jgi:hypothetical protein
LKKREDGGVKKGGRRGEKMSELQPADGATLPSYGGTDRRGQMIITAVQNLVKNYSC